jgi:C_GCAxxG_C_C family probable redox protein
MVPEGESELISKIYSGFGGGIGLCGSVCGSLTGSIMAVGIKYGSNDKGEGNNVKAYAKANTLYHRFEKQHGTVL